MKESPPLADRASKNTLATLRSTCYSCDMVYPFFDQCKAVCKPVLQAPVVGHACTKSVHYHPISSISKAKQRWRYVAAVQWHELCWAAVIERHRSPVPTGMLGRAELSGFGSGRRTTHNLNGRRKAQRLGLTLRILKLVLRGLAQLGRKPASYRLAPHCEAN